MAVLGLSKDDLAVTFDENTLLVSGNQTKAENLTYLHREISGRHFELAEHITVSSSSHANGLPQIELAPEVPEGKKTRPMSINTKSTEQKTAA